MTGNPRGVGLKWSCLQAHNTACNVIPYFIRQRLGVDQSVKLSPLALIAFIFAFITFRKRSLRRLCFYMCLSFCSQGGLGLCPGVSVPVFQRGVCLGKVGVSVWGVSVLGSLSWGVSVQGRGLGLGGSVQGALCPRGVSVWGRGLCPGSLSSPCAHLTFCVVYWQ